ncbi:hemolysin III family protein [Weissella coleopterorum]|uniref:Hemolysin III family protein n=1 Tax=Weissella coleopterorum TaxID=2714949 RepID=A0A6G8AYP5_9LACO|nr:hemolysin III family protein [Weissella coleopterorum]QIL50126.1 hemolysin III family protein [Weissella coleopterorum]
MKLDITNHKTVIYETWNAITHGLGLLISLMLVVALIQRGMLQHLPFYQIASLWVYSATLLLLYFASTLFHCLAFTPAYRFFQIFDHSNIFLLIAGTYTPYCVITLNNQHGFILLISIWLLALGGIFTHILSHGRHQRIETTFYIVMGWLCLITAKELYQNLSTAGFWLLVSGGIVFTLGAIIYSFPKIPGLHLIWHFFVMAGTWLMFFSIYFNI